LAYNVKENGSRSLSGPIGVGEIVNNIDPLKGHLPLRNSENFSFMSKTVFPFA
jgi:hypothetical protein